MKRIFKPEFINRIDEIMVFHPLDKENMKQIVTMVSKNLSHRCKKQMDINLTITPAMKDYIVEKYTDVKMGARPMKRAIQTEIEDALAEEILHGNVKQGDKVSVVLKEKKAAFKVK